MSKEDEIQILDDIELGDVVGGVVKKKAAKRKVAKKKVAKKKSVRVAAITNGGAVVTVPANAVDKANGLEPAP